MEQRSVLSAINNGVFGPCQLEIFYWEIPLPVTVSVFCGKLNSLLVDDARIDYKMLKYNIYFPQE